MTTDEFLRQVGVPRRRSFTQAVLESVEMIRALILLLKYFFKLENFLDMRFDINISHSFTPVQDVKSASEVAVGSDICFNLFA